MRENIYKIYSLHKEKTCQNTSENKWTKNAFCLIFSSVFLGWIYEKIKPHRCNISEWMNEWMMEKNTENKNSTENSVMKTMNAYTVNLDDDKE